MKKILVLLGVILASVILMVSCGENTSTSTSSSDPSATTPGSAALTTPPATTTEGGVPAYVDGKLCLIQNGETNYVIVFPEGATQNTKFKDAVTDLRNTFREYGASQIKTLSDFVERGEEDTTVIPDYEILIGNVDRPELEEIGELGFNKAVIRVVGKKVIITGGNESMIAQAVQQFITDYMPEGGNTLLLPSDLNLPIEMNMAICTETGKTYMEMAQEVYDAFNEQYWTGKRPERNYFWDSAEMLETYIDAYEATGDEEYKNKMLTFAKTFISEWGADWTWNDFNDDIMWACIAFARIYNLTGQRMYLTYAQRNFDQTYKDAYSTELGGGMFWRKENETKNSCVNCPGAIAACLLGEITGDKDYYEKAKGLMEWEFNNMFEKNTGKVYDSFNIKGEKSTWASTYNQGTFIGACTYLYKYYQDEIYLQYAERAANYAMTKLTTGGILDNGEDGGNDLPGFKGILTRWLYRYAKETNNLEILVFLQTNAATAYSNQNENGLIWTNWHEKAPASVEGHITFGWSTAVSLMFNSLPW